MVATAASAVYAQFESSVTLLSCASSLVSLASMAVNLAILNLVMTAKKDVFEMKAEKEDPQEDSVIEHSLQEDKAHRKSTEHAPLFRRV